MDASRWTSRRLLGWLALVLLGPAACGGAAPMSDHAEERAYHAMAAQGVHSTQTAEVAPAPGAWSDDMLAELVEQEGSDSTMLHVAQQRAPVAAQRAEGPGTHDMLAAKQAAPKAAPPAEPPARQGAGAERGPLLVYEAWLQLAVFEVEERQRALIAIAERHGGFLAHQQAMQVVVRVPASNFKAALAEAEGVGNLLDRRMQTHDVTEEFRDIETRLDSARKVRLRLLALLERAVNVEESLAIERELERLLAEIERMEGRLRFMADRIAFSTITANFRPLAEESPADDVKLPFLWLEGLGLRNLMELDR